MYMSVSFEENDIHLIQK